MMLRNTILALTLLFSVAQGIQAQTLLTENFDNVAGLAGAGWFFRNNSFDPDPTGQWQQGLSGSSLNPPPTGANGSFAVSTFDATTGNSATGETLNDWMLTPVVTLTNGAQIRFFTRTNTGNIFPERLQIRISPTGASTNVGTTFTDVGDYTQLLLDINPTYTGGAAGYPDVWTEFVINVSGLGGPLNTRVAFRHFVEDSGFFGANGDNNGVDNLRIIGAAVPEPASIALVSTVLVGGLYYYRRQSSLKSKATETRFAKLA